MMSESELSANQEKAIAALLSSATLGAAADKVGVSERTMFRWLNDPTFDAAYRASRRHAVRQAVAQLQRHSSTAVAVMLSIMADRSAPSSTRLTAAAKIVELAFQSVELEDLAAEFEQMKATLARLEAARAAS